MAPREGDLTPRDEIELAKYKSALEIRKKASRFSKWFCKYFGHKEAWQGSFLQTGNGELTCYCKRCGETILNGTATRF